MLAKSGREPHEKRDTLRRLIRSAEGLKNAIIFCNRKRDVATLHRSLLRHGFSVLALHGDMDQPARTAALEQFRKGEVTLLVASDVAARGLDIPDVSHIYNFDVPHHADDYVHRIGRTGRAGRTGTAITLVAGVERRKGGRGDRKTDRPADSLDERRALGAAVRRRSRRARRRRRRQRHNRGAARPTTTASRRPAASASIARIPQRPPQPAKPRTEEADTSHLPAFLLRPVPLKA